MGLHLIDDVETILHFSEFGVVLLLFLIELELNPSRLWNLGHAIFGLGALQVVITTGVISAIGVFFINDPNAVFIIAIALVLSSTAMAMQLVNGKNLTHTGAGQSGFAVLLFQDLAVILLLALMPLMAHQTGSSSQAAPMSLVYIVGVIALILIGWRYLVRHIFREIAKTELREIFTAFALFLVIGIALLM